MLPMPIRLLLSINSVRCPHPMERMSENETNCFGFLVSSNILCVYDLSSESFPFSFLGDHVEVVVSFNLVLR